MNTAVDLFYRDGCNYKTSTVVVFVGSPEPVLTERLLAALDEGECLVPEQVALRHPATTDPTFSLRFPDEEDDHGFVELATDGIETTNRTATDQRTFAEFVTACEAAAAVGWDPMISITAAGGWTDPDRAARLRNGEPST